MKENNLNDKLFDAILKVAAEEAMEREMEQMPSCEEMNEQHKPSANLDKRIRKIISRHYRKQKIKSLQRNFLRITAVLAIFIVASSVVLFSVEATRNYIFNAVIKWQEDHFSIEYTGTNEPANEIYRPSYLPKGFEEVLISDTGRIIRIIYQNEEGENITLMQSPAESSNILVDNEDKDISIIKISGKDAFLVEATTFDKPHMILWEDNGVAFQIISEIEVSELILIAESIKK